MTAVFSPCRTWRYTLEREVAPLTGHGTCVFIGLNPSTADEVEDDPTIRRCIRFTRDWGYAKYVMLNLFGIRSTDPLGIADAADPVGPDNDEWIRRTIADADIVIAAWGAFPTNGRAEQVLPMIPLPFCLGVTSNGSPRHPLYVPAATRPHLYLVGDDMRTMTVSVKDTNGEWTTLNALEIRVGQPITVRPEVGTVSIQGAGANDPNAIAPAVSA